MAHTKNKKITILNHSKGKNKLGAVEYIWGPLTNGENIWAYYRHASGKEIVNSIVIDTKVEAIFEINWRNDIDTSMRILYQGKQYQISQIDDFEGRKTDLKIFAYVMK